jgi:diacylglycerol kinase family enzyme
MAGLLIANPKASAVDEQRLTTVHAALPAGTELRLTVAAGEATDLAREVAGRVDALYVFGGDGTFNEVLNGLDGTTPLGLIPGGGANVLPRALGVPRSPVEAARRLGAEAKPRRIALGRVNGRRFGFCAGIGLDAEIVRAVDGLGRRPDGSRPGNLTYAWTGLKTFSRHRLRIEPSIEVTGHGRAALVLVTNSPAYTYAGPIPLRISPEATFEGGLDLVAPTQVRWRNLARMARFALGWGNRAKAGDLLYVHDADRFEVVCDVPLPLQVDGEDLGDVEHALFEAERAAVTVLV